MIDLLVCTDLLVGQIPDYAPGRTLDIGFRRTGWFSHEVYVRIRQGTWRAPSGGRSTTLAMVGILLRTADARGWQVNKMTELS